VQRAEKLKVLDRQSMLEQ
jgi:hypothetical protein